jgi:hypothetical protein
LDFPATQPGFLSGYSIYIHENVPDRYQMADNINSESGKFALNIGDKDITHYLMQNDLSTKELNSLKKFCAKNEIQLASIYWLTDCLEERKLLDIDEYPAEFNPSYVLPARTQAFEEQTAEAAGEPLLDENEIFQQLLDLKRGGTPISTEQRALVNAKDKVTKTLIPVQPEIYLGN